MAVTSLGSQTESRVGLRFSGEEETALRLQLCAGGAKQAGQVPEIHYRVGGDQEIIFPAAVFEKAFNIGYREFAIDSPSFCAFDHQRRKIDAVEAPRQRLEGFTCKPGAAAEIKNIHGTVDADHQHLGKRTEDLRRAIAEVVDHRMV